MNCKICEQTSDQDLCGWCSDRIGKLVEINVAHYGVNINWGGGKIAWSDAYYLRDLTREHGITEVLEFGTGLSTEIFVILGIKVISCDVLKHHIDLFKKIVPLMGMAEFIHYGNGADERSRILPDFDSLYPGKRWDLVFVDGPQERTQEVELAKKLSSRFIYLHDPGLAEQYLDLGPGWKRMGDTYTFERTNA